MDSKQIYEGMTKGNKFEIWDTYTVVMMGELGYTTIADASIGAYDNAEPLADEEAEANAHAITTALNATYVAGIDPNKVKEMYDMLQNLSYLVKHDPKQTRTYKELTDLLTAAKLP